MAREKPANGKSANDKAANAQLASTSFARNYLAYLLARASFIVSSEFHATLKNWDLSVPEWRVLVTLGENGVRNEGRIFTR